MQRLHSPRGSEAALPSTSGDVPYSHALDAVLSARPSIPLPLVIDVWASQMRCVLRVYFISLGGIWIEVVLIQVFFLG